MKFVKIVNRNGELPFWWEYDESTPIYNATIYNMSGGRQTEWDLRDYEIVEAEDWEYLDYNNTIILSNIYKTGWLSPNGKFYGCDYRCHNLQAQLVHNKSEFELENLGFIKITLNLNWRLSNSKYNILCYCKPTQKQFIWFKENYNELDKEDVLQKLTHISRLRNL